jgi:hypothetical protein
MVGQRILRVINRNARRETIGTDGQLGSETDENLRIILGVRNNKQLRDHAREMLYQVREELRKVDPQMEPGRLAQKIRNSEDYPAAAEWLAEIEWQLFTIADGNIDEAVGEFARHKVL